MVFNKNDLTELKITELVEKWLTRDQEGLGSIPAIQQWFIPITSFGLVTHKIK